MNTRQTNKLLWVAGMFVAVIVGIGVMFEYSVQAGIAVMYGLFLLADIRESLGLLQIRHENSLDEWTS